MCVPFVSFVKKKKKKLQNTARTQEQEESNIVLQNKESIHALNSNNAFEN